MLLSADVHTLFDAFKVSINPDDNYKVVCFAPDALNLYYNIAGRHLDQTFLDKGNRPVDEVLRWHYRQAVLVNIRGPGSLLPSPITWLG
ncbi:hypothetical protein B9Z19DRAFT_1134522 [Tuber borchii]|uniref:HNH nuclease domain-containing protein n=1 Tax=Tuber borchii TaxID=42251 RepID=A0A2T6ZE23_TUBBO|nr:hypothetical protein B9Z19DRAFT_1134522 [Tuber borchii]